MIILLMTFALKVSLKDAEKARIFLQSNEFYDATYLVKKDGGFIFFPVTRKFNVKTLNVRAEIVDTELPLRHKETMADLLSQVLTTKELEILPGAYEVVGDILILELPDELKKKEKRIAKVFLKMHGHVKTVVKKAEIHSGVYRTRTVTVLAGENKKDTIYRESGCRFKVHLEKMYFSSRLAGERLRIAGQVKKGEDVLVMFSGCAPYCCVITKHSAACRVYGIEINPDAHAYGLENVRLNKLESRVKLFRGDVRKALPALRRKFDRIVMPLPKTGEEFLPLALGYVKNGGIIYYYAFLRLDEINDCKKKIQKICTQNKKRCRILRWTKVGQHAPYVWRVCFDVKIT